MATRRQVIGGGAAMALAGRAGAAARRVPRSPAFTDSVLDALPDDDHIWNMVQRLAALCPASTASASHLTYLAMLEAELKLAGIEPHRDVSTMPYWQPHAYGLTLGGHAVPVTGYQPYSGATGAEGIEAPLVDAGRMTGSIMAGGVGGFDLSNAAGKIALIETTYLGNAALEANQVVHCYPESERANLPANHHSPLFSGINVPPSSEVFAKAGVRAVVYIWNGYSDANAMYQMQSFVARPGNVPILWVGAEMGAMLKAQAAKGASARLTLHATSHPGTQVHTLWGVLPGMTDEVVVVNTHTDGTNANEENGGIAVVSLARALARLPKEKRRRTHVFVMTPAHFSHGLAKGAGDWQKDHPDIMARTAMTLTIEHLGATEWLDNAQRQYRPTGAFSWATLYTRSQALADLGNQAAASMEVKRVMTCFPTRVYPGEGGPFDRNHVPTLSYMVTPDYLIATPPTGGEISKLSRQRLCDEVRMFARCLEKIDAMPREAFRAA